MDEQFVRNRIAEILFKNDLSERSVSLALGHSGSYLNGIISGKQSLSLKNLLELCDYLGLSLCDFFNDQSPLSPLETQIISEIRTLNDTDLNFLMHVINYIKACHKS